MDGNSDSGEYEFRRSHLTQDEMDAIAERAAKRALQKIYAEVGQSVLTKAAWLIGVVIVCLALYLAGKNALPRP